MTFVEIWVIIQRTELNMDEINLIEKTRQQLIAQHGENKVEIVNGMTLHKINEYLTNFDLFEQNFESYLAFLNLPHYINILKWQK